MSYRAGDQPNNAFSLHVLDPGEAATTAGTSGVVYGVAGKAAYDPLSRVNTFVHVSHAEAAPRYGVLLCVNGTGILYSWMKRILVGESGAVSYDQMNQVAAQAPIGADGLTILPFGNGAERTLENRSTGGSLLGIDFNRHGIPHLLRASQEGIVFALQYGLKIMRDMGMEARTVRAGHANMFLSPIFREAFSTVTGARVELFNTDGAQGAARGAGVGAGVYRSMKEAFVGLTAVKTVDPDKGAEGRLRGSVRQVGARAGEEQNAPEGSPRALPGSPQGKSPRSEGSPSSPRRLSFFRSRTRNRFRQGFDSLPRRPSCPGCFPSPEQRYPRPALPSEQPRSRMSNRSAVAPVILRTASSRGRSFCVRASSSTRTSPPNAAGFSAPTRSTAGSGHEETCPVPYELGKNPVVARLLVEHAGPAARFFAPARSTRQGG